MHERNIIEWKQFQIIHKDEHWYKRQLEEAIYITSDRNLTREPSVSSIDLKMTVDQ